MMSKNRPSYAPEFRQQMIELVRDGRAPEELAKKFEPSAQTIRNWVVQADRDEGPGARWSKTRFTTAGSSTHAITLTSPPDR